VLFLVLILFIDEKLRYQHYCWCSFVLLVIHHVVVHCVVVRVNHVIVGIHCVHFFLKILSLLFTLLLVFIMLLSVVGAHHVVFHFVVGTTPTFESPYKLEFHYK
jgi:hypothetical protein